MSTEIRSADPGDDAARAAPPLLDAAEAEPGEFAPPATAPMWLPAGPMRSQVFRLALPMLGEQFFVFLVGLVDTYLAGTISKEATAAVGTASYMGWTINLVFTLVGTGLAAVVSRCFGEGDRATASRTLNQSIILAVGMGGCASVLAFFNAPLLARFLLATPEAQSICTSYLRVDSIAYLLASVTTVGMAALRAAGDTKTPMHIMLVVNVINAGIAALLVTGTIVPSLGPIGIAIGEVAGRAAGGLITLVVLARGLHGMQLRWVLLRLERAVVWRVLRIGLPAATDSFIHACAQFAFIRIIAHSRAGAEGTANYAAHMIAMRIEAISYLPAFAWGTAAATIVGQYLGARRPEEARRAGHVAARQGVAVCAVVGASFVALAHFFYGLMTEDQAVRDVGIPAFRLLGFAQPFIGVAIIYTMALRGAGDTRWPMLFAILGGVFLRVPIAYLGGIVLGGGLLGAWCGMWADNVTRATCALARYLHGGWRRVRV